MQFKPESLVLPKPMKWYGLYGPHDAVPTSVIEAEKTPRLDDFIKHIELGHSPEQIKHIKSNSATYKVYEVFVSKVKLNKSSFIGRAGVTQW